MKILLTGARGMLAHDVARVLERNNHLVVKTDIQQGADDIMRLDIRDRDGVFAFVREYSPDFIFHLAAETNVDLCEERPDHAFKVNAEGTENVATAALVYDTPLLYVSTAAVFPGDKAEPYTEDDEPAPVNVYAKAKLEGERLVRSLLERYFIVRAGWMIGGYDLDKKFVFKLIRQLMAGAKELYAVHDKYGSPTFTWDLAENMLLLVSSGRYGLYHCSNKGTATRYDIACELVRLLGLQEDVKVVSVDSSQFPLPAPRGRSEMIRNLRLGLLGMDRMPDWRKSLEVYLSGARDSLHPDEAGLLTARGGASLKDGGRPDRPYPSG
ncbi:MAG: dTDP-4-dehydrorhamnose reductase [Syntrophales bacterium]|nr:dTDP-4-dehydrorhamnose reductase [Syntrophales bacterium]MDD5232912.1 dTDP-4-dehydrorhamnose reductase [Syntrophales bacterium]